MNQPLQELGLKEYSEKSCKETQIVIRVSEAEKANFKAYFAKHGLSISRGFNIAFEVLSVMEGKGLVELSKNGYSIKG